MKIDIWHCFFAKTSKQDEKKPEDTKEIVFNKDSVQLSVKKVMDKRRNNKITTPFPSRENIDNDELQFHLELDDNRFTQKKV